ncbi:MAG: hypothetical protein LBU65_03320 [Planctomycetaceae bacterium]|nr:hypothetical protein [Planctomycetaceae bacterium]
MTDSQESDGNTKQITITLQKDAPIGEISAKLYVGDGENDVTVRVIGNIRGQYYALPQSLIIGPVSNSDSKLSSTITLKTRETGTT